MYNPTLTKKQIIDIVNYNANNFQEKFLDSDFIINDENTQINQIKERAIDYIKDNLPSEITLDELIKMDLNHKIFNEDYFIIGYSKADKFIAHNFHSMLSYMEDFDIVPIETIKDCEKFANLFAYWVGYNLLASPYDELKEVHNIH